MSCVAFSIDPGLRPADVAPVFARYGRVHLPQFLAGPGATELHRSLLDATPWSRTLNTGDRNLTVPLEVWEAQPAEVRAQIEAAARESARDGFQYLYDNYNVSRAVEGGEARGLLVEQLLAWLNTAAFLDFIREVTGDARPASADAQVSRYSAGHFLTQHDDESRTHSRLYAYVLNLTPVWKLDWGGLLLFPDADGHVAEGYAPKFNALNLFRVPQAHTVTQVADFAGASRYSVTGWILAGG